MWQQTRDLCPFSLALWHSCYYGYECASIYLLCTVTLWLVGLTLLWEFTRFIFKVSSLKEKCILFKNKIWKLTCPILQLLYNFALEILNVYVYCNTFSWLILHGTCYAAVFHWNSLDSNRTLGPTLYIQQNCNVSYLAIPEMFGSQQIAELLWGFS